jgi:ketosteroid isomerase-like protein
VNHDDVQAWLDRYVHAWETYDEAEIGELFSEDAEYRYHPWDEPVRGRDAIVRDWVAPHGSASTRDAPGTYAAAYTAYAVDDDVAVAVGTSTYWTDATRTGQLRMYHNVYLLAFDAAGRCRLFTEYFMKAPG